jgi:hypothetical protein
LGQSFGYAQDEPSRLTQSEKLEIGPSQGNSDDHADDDINQSDNDDCGESHSKSHGNLINEQPPGG